MLKLIKCNYSDAYKLFKVTITFAAGPAAAKQLDRCNKGVIF